MTDKIYQDFAPCESEAKRRAEEWKKRDPFEQIPPSLLSGEHIEAYVRQTAMLHPIDLERRGALKAASCEILPRHQFIRWESGKKIITEINEDSEIVLPANSITFAQIEPTIRLPDYIAIRFNLRIKHVHRGLLLGTGPLVDPTFKGNILIPLHNLTDSDYIIRSTEGLIWVEFTKTSRKTDRGVSLGLLPPRKDLFAPSDGANPTVEFYFEKANKNRPIESSIPGEIKSAKEDSTKALSIAKEAKLTNQIYASIGFLAVLAAVVGLYNFLQGANTRVDSLGGRLETSIKATAETSAALASLKPDLERSVSALTLEREAAAGRDKANLNKLDALNIRLYELSTRIEKLENDTTASRRPVSTKFRRRPSKSKSAR